MGAAFGNVGIVARRGGDLVRESVSAVRAVLNALDAKVWFEQESELDGAPEAQLPRARLAEHCDLIVVVGGDGSILGVARELAHHGIPVLGVNRGGLGFLAGIAPEQIDPQLIEVMHGEYVAEEHFLLDATVCNGDQAVAASPALNDVVVHGGGNIHMLDFTLRIDDERVYDMRGDGLIIATPTGSTAYALSAGGPIMHPDLDAIVIVPMFPHTLNSRPLVVRGSSQIEVQVHNAEPLPGVASCDSQVQLDLRATQILKVRKHPRPLQLLYPTEHSFYESCRSKLDWASRLGGRGG